MTPGEAWIRLRTPSAPAELILKMTGAIPDDPSIPAAEALAEGALVLFAEVTRGSGAREDALPLLAADALLTHAFQAAAEANHGEIAEFASRWSDRLQMIEVSA